MGLSRRADATRFPLVFAVPHDIPWSRCHYYSHFMDWGSYGQRGKFHDQKHSWYRGGEGRSSAEGSTHSRHLPILEKDEEAQPNMLLFQTLALWHALDEWYSSVREVG